VILKNRFLISAKIYQWETITVKDGVSKGIDLPYSSFGTAPSLVAGSFNLGFLKDHHFASMNSITKPTACWGLRWGFEEGLWSTCHEL
jgi:hypothetical protein